MDGGVLRRRSARSVMCLVEMAAVMPRVALEIVLRREAQVEMPVIEHSAFFFPRLVLLYRSGHRSFPLHDGNLVRSPAMAQMIRN